MKDELLAMSTRRPARKVQFASWGAAAATVVVPFIMWLIPDDAAFGQTFQQALIVVLTPIFSGVAAFAVGYQTLERRENLTVTTTPEEGV